MSHTFGSLRNTIDSRWPAALYRLQLVHKRNANFDRLFAKGNTRFGGDVTPIWVEVWATLSVTGHNWIAVTFTNTQQIRKKFWRRCRNIAEQRKCHGWWCTGSLPKQHVIDYMNESLSSQRRVLLPALFQWRWSGRKCKYIFMCSERIRHLKRSP